LGTTAFGGPAAHIAIMEDELVRRRRWVSREKFLDMLGASNLIPGPSSSELAIHIGYWLGGWRGLIVAGICFILPAACMVGALAWAYVRFGKMPAVSGILYGIKPVVIAVILQALWGLGRTAINTWFIAVVGLICVGLSAWGLHPLLLLLIAGAAVILADQTIYTSRKIAFAPVSILHSIGRWPRSLAAATTGALAAVAPLSLGSLFLVFLKFGAVIFGSGYVLLAFLRADLVVQRGWLTDPQLIDAIAIGQVTPGPVFTTATFIGYLLYGTRGAVVATIGVFLPAFGGCKRPSSVAYSRIQDRWSISRWCDRRLTCFNGRGELATRSNVNRRCSDSNTFRCLALSFAAISVEFCVAHTYRGARWPTGSTLVIVPADRRSYALQSGTSKNSGLPCELLCLWKR
jgi:chromate transporter